MESLCEYCREAGITEIECLHGRCNDQCTECEAVAREVGDILS